MFIYPPYYIDKENVHTSRAILFPQMPFYIDCQIHFSEFGAQVKKKTKGNKLTKEVNYPIYLFISIQLTEKLHKALIMRLYKYENVSNKSSTIHWNPFSLLQVLSSSHTSFVYLFVLFYIKLYSFYSTLLFYSFLNPSASEIRILICFLCLFFLRKQKNKMNHNNILSFSLENSCLKNLWLEN